MSTRPLVLVGLHDDFHKSFLPERQLERLAQAAEVVITNQDWPQHPRLAEADVLLTGWGSGKLTPEVLERAPRLAALMHTGGSVRAFLDKDVWAHRPDFRVTTQTRANGDGVVLYSFGAILLCLRDVFELRERYRAGRGLDQAQRLAIATEPSRGLAGRTVGIVSASRIGRGVMELLRPWPSKVAVYDPFLSAEQAAELGAEKVDTLVELAARSDVFSIHAPWLPETEGMINAEVLAALPDGVTVINTARGAIIDEPALIAELSTGRLKAILDVTWPEPPDTDSPLWDLDNAFLTPHIAGSLGTDLEVLGAGAVTETLRFLASEPPLEPLLEADYDRMA